MNTEFVYPSCSASNDQVFEQIISGISYINNIRGTTIEVPYVTLSNIFQDKWVIYQTKIEGYGSNNLVQLHIFYKDSSG